jgi:hypothetical protein
MNGVSDARKHTLHRRRFLVNRNPDNCTGLVHEQLDIAKAFTGSSENPTGDVDQGRPAEPQSARDLPPVPL